MATGTHGEFIEKSVIHINDIQVDTGSLIAINRDITTASGSNTFGEESSDSSVEDYGRLIVNNREVTTIAEPPSVTNVLVRTVSKDTDIGIEQFVIITSKIPLTLRLPNVEVAEGHNDIYPGRVIYILNKSNKVSCKILPATGGSINNLPVYTLNGNLSVMMIYNGKAWVTN